MKTKLLIITAFLTMSWNSVYSQLYRYADLQVRFTTPEQNTQFNSPSTISFKFQVVNQGPDTIYKTDTIFYSPSHTFSGWTNVRKQAFTKTVPPNDSIEFDDTIKVNSRAFKKAFQLSFSSVPMAYGPDNGQLKLQNEFSEDRKDNADYIDLYHSGNLSTDLQEIRRLKVYPNPVLNDKFTIQYPNSLQSIKVLNGLSQEMSVKISNNNNGFVEVDVKNLSSGMYYLCVKSEGTSSIEKLIIQ